jgi:sulfatase maturation enzyme AslB (radical SAM superfamily)
MACPPEIRQLCLVLTADCNLTCSYCYQNARKPSSMSWETVRASIDLLADASDADLEITLTGGEPLLEFGLVRRAVGYALALSSDGRRISFRVLTNGLLISDEVAEFLAAHDVAVQLSFDGSVDAQELRCPGSFATLDALLRRLRTRWPEYFDRLVAVNVTLTPATVPTLAASIDHLISTGVGAITVQPSITPCPDWRPEAIDTLDEQFARVFERSLRLLEETGRVPVAALSGSAAGPSRRVDCLMCGIAPVECPTVDVDGTVYACSAFAESYQKMGTPLLLEAARATRLGRLSDADFGDRRRAFESGVTRLPLFVRGPDKRSSYGRCAECEYRNACFVCPASIAHGGSDANRVPDFYCAWNRVTLKYRGRFPLKPAGQAILPIAALAAERDKWRAIADALAARSRAPEGEH